MVVVGTVVTTVDVIFLTVEVVLGTVVVVDTVVGPGAGDGEVVSNTVDGGLKLVAVGLGP